MLPSAALLLLLAATPWLADAACERDDYNDINGRCYKFVREKRDFADAQEYCENEGGNLAWIPDYSTSLDIIDNLDLYKEFWIGARLRGYLPGGSKSHSHSHSSSGRKSSCKSGSCEDVDYSTLDIIRESDGEEFELDQVGFWGKGQPKLKRDYGCVLVKEKKGKKGRHGEEKGFEWEMKKCKDKKYFLCELKCDAGEVRCNDGSCEDDRSYCGEVPPPVLPCDAEHDFSVDGPTFRSTGYTDGSYPANSVCIYRLYTTSDFILKLLFDIFELGDDNQDYIEIYVGSLDISSATLFGRFFNRDALAGRFLFSSNNRIVIVFRTDGRTTRDGRGFSITNYPFSVPESRFEVFITVTISDGLRWIESPGYNDLSGELPGYTATWYFTAELFTQIVFALDEGTVIDVGSSVEIWDLVDGEDPVLITIFTGGQVLSFTSFVSTTHTCSVIYRTGAGPHWSARGFKLSFIISTAVECKQEFTSLAGSLTSPGFNTTVNAVEIPYPVNYDCTYEIKMPDGGPFTFWFDALFGIDIDDSLVIDTPGVTPNSDLSITTYQTIAPIGQYPALSFISVTFVTDIVTANPGIAGFKIYFCRNCPDLIVTEWTQLSQASPYQYGDTVDISCIEGYEFQDNGLVGITASVTCLWGGVWSTIRIPDCEPVYCGLPPSIEDGYVSQSTGLLFGDHASYECLDGQMIVGVNRVNCTANKTWTEPPSCSPLRCVMEQPMDGIASHVLRNGSATPINDTWYGFGAVVELDCVDGYYVQGVKSIVCEGEDGWSDELGTCEKGSCFYQPVKDGIMSVYTREELPMKTAGDVDYWTDLLQYFFAQYTQISNVGQLPSILFGEMLYVHCRTGFVIEDTQNVTVNATCTSDGLFDYIPDCVDTNECNDNPCEQYCIDTPGSYYCMCGSQYTLDSDGHNCTLIPGCDFYPDACDQICTSVDLPQWFECSCDEPYVLYDRLGSNGYVKHPADTYSALLRVNQSCVLPQCPLQDIVMDFNDQTEILGQYNDTAYPFHYNDSVEILCEVGYTFPDGDLSKVFHCGMFNMSLGWFDSSNNSLADIMCSREATCVGDVILETVNYTTPYKQVCSTPFVYEIVSTCDFDPEAGVYVLSADVLCPVVDCGMPEVMHTLGSVNLTIDCTTLGCSFEFTCEDGSQPLPHGVSNTIVCGENGNWNYSNIYCDGTTCDDPGMVFGTQRYATEDMLPNITFSLANLKSGGRVYYKCIKEGYELYNNGDLVNSTYCNGITFSPPVDDFVCIDSQSPSVPYCPNTVDVFRLSTFGGAPFEQGDFLGYPSPIFEDNGGIQSIEVTPNYFSLDHVYYLDSLPVEYIAIDFESQSANCSIEFVAVDVVTPVLNCSDLVIELNQTHIEKNVTAEMILSAVQMDSSDAYQIVTVEFASSGTEINPDIIKYKINQNARVTVERTFYAGDPDLGMNRENRTVSSYCSVPIIPKPDLCAEVFAPVPADATMVCGELPGGGRECNYTCTNPDAVFFQFSSNLNNTATSQCIDPDVGFPPVFDCIVTDYAKAIAGHTLIIGDGNLFMLSLSCYEKFVEGYLNWTLSEVCNNSVADIQFSQVPAGDEVPLSSLLLYNSGTGQISGFPQWNIIPQDGLWGTETICNSGAPELRSIQLPSESKLVNLTGMDDCLQPTYFYFSILTSVNYVCTDSTMIPIQIGEVMFEGNAYPTFSCFECPAGTYVSDGACKACPVGQFQSSAGVRSECFMCPPGTVTIETGQSSCQFECPAGYYGENGVYPCRPCPKNSYSLNTSYCEMCPADTKGFLNAQSSNDSCRPVCEAGYYSETGYAPADGNCTACPVNFISTVPMSTTCDPCGTNQYTNGLVAQTSCTNAPFCSNVECKSNRCDGYHNRYYCLQGCENPDAWQGTYCDDPIDNCDSMACDPRGTSSCMNGTCNCNIDIAMGTLCDNITVTCDGVVCENGGKCFVVTEGSGNAANLVPMCLCGPEWSGDVCTLVEDKCITAGCVNGQCVNEDVRARCDCDLGWEGYLCDEDIKGCMSSPCHNGGNCTDVSGSAVTTDAYAFTCSCPIGFSGDQCEVRENECDVVSCGNFAFCLDDYTSINSVFCINIYFSIYVDILISISTVSFCESLGIQCDNGGMCVDDPLYKFRCECPESGIYGGLYCQSRIDFCYGNQCGVGNCTNKEDEAGYDCECPEGYKFDGDTCVNIDECDMDEDICNSGTCMDTIGSYYCTCDPGWAGKDCDTFINQCLFTTCLGNGTCQPNNMGYECFCTEGRTGRICEEELSLCQGQCVNGGKCFEAFNDYACICPEPFFGTHCELMPDPCDEKPCSFNGTCTPNGQYFDCQCSAGHAGTTCEVWVDECSDDPCDEGDCVLNYGSGFTCDCREGYVGILCDEKLDPCDPDPCPVKATCVRQGFTAYTCVCPAGFVGDSCETPIDGNFDCYLKVGDIIKVLKPTVSEFWSTSKFTLSAWIRPDRIIDDYGNFIEIIQITVESEILLTLTAHGVIFNNVWYNYTTDADLSLNIGGWVFVGVSVEGSTITVYHGGLVIQYDIEGGVPEEKFGSVNVIVSPTKRFVGFCSQVYLWAGASFSKSGGSLLNGLLDVGIGQLPNLDNFAGSFIQYYWNIGLYLLSPFCEVGRPSGYCIDCDDSDRGTYLEFQRDCPDDITIDTSARSVAVNFQPPIFLANGEVVTPTSNISPGDVLPIGKHKVQYSVSVNRKKLKCKFNIYVRYGCDGVVLNGRCIRPYEQSGLTYARAKARCANFGGELMIVQSQDDIDTVVSAIYNTGLLDQQFMVEVFLGSQDRPTCVSVNANQVHTLSECTQAIAAICGREISGEEACALPRFNEDSVSVDLVTTSRLTKYALTCAVEGEVLPSYIPKFITCYPEGNWDTTLGNIPDCVLPALTQFRFRFRIVVTFRIRIRTRCVTSGNYISRNIFSAIENVLNTLNGRWSGGLLNPRKTPKKCCNDPDYCEQLSSQCESEPYAFRTSCQTSVFGRRKRQAEDLNDVDIGLNLDELPEMLNAGGVDLSPEDVITQAIAANEFVEELRNGPVVVNDADNPNPLDGFNAVEALDCAEGYENLDGDECSSCSPGTYWTVNGTCDFCPVDTYQPNTTESSCAACPNDRPITYFVGSASENDCKAVAAAGQFYNSLTGTIETCPIATYQPNENQLSCTACDLGLTTIAPGSNSSAQCINICASGQQTDNFGNCVNCTIGFYRDAAVDPVCVACPTGYYTEGEGAVSEVACDIVDCGIGEYRHVPSNTCMNCSRGNYQDTIRQESCEPCGDNYTTADVGSTSLSDCQFICPSGYEQTGSQMVCTKCALGMYRTKDIDNPTDKCMSCSVDYFTTPSTASLSEADCTVLECPAGMEAIADNTTCVLCANSTYSTDVSFAGGKCEACRVDYITLAEGATHEDNCTLDCPDAGEETGKENCTLCMQGYYAPSGEQTCTACDATLTTGVLKWNTVGEGSVAQSDCSIALCGAGYYRKNDTATESCEPCANGTFQSSDYTTVGMCEPCPLTASNASQTTLSTASQSVLDCRVTCPAGQEDMGDACEECAVGFYKEMGGPTPCVKCADGLTTASTGSISENDNCSIALCGPGNYSNGKVCSVCMIGYYQEEDNFIGSECMPCEPVGLYNTTTSDPGSTSEDDCEVVCPAGYIPHQTKGCEVCPVNTYVDGDSCQACVGFTTNNMIGGVNESACTHKICVPGEENDPADSKSCVACPLNTYSTSGVMCEPCPNSEITKSTGSAGVALCILDCADGREYTSASGSCELCERGTYRLRADGGFNCLNCPAGNTTAGEGASSCPVPECPAGQYAMEMGGVYTCTDCPLNTYQASVGSFSCIDCGPETYTNTTGASRETQCLPVPNCNNMPCPDNNHVCTDDPAGRERKCACHSAYDAVGTTSCRHVCDRDDRERFCANDGICNGDVDDISLVCACITGYQGVNCTEFEGINNTQSETVLIIVGVVVGLVLIGAIIGCIVAFTKGAASSAGAKMAGYSAAAGAYPAQAMHTPNNYVDNQFQMREVDSISYNRAGTPRGSNRNSRGYYIQ